MLSCGRWDLLAQSLESYSKAMPESTRMIICDDSMEKLGQAAALDELVRQGLATDSDYFVMLEDDWVFDGDKSWFHGSKAILDKHPEIMIVGLSLSEQIRNYMGPIYYLQNVPIRKHEPWRLSENHGYWNGWISSPRLMRRKDLEILPKFSGFAAEETFDQVVWRPLYDSGRRSIWLNKQYVSHIGGGRSLFPTGDRLPVETRTWLKSHEERHFQALES